MEKKTVPNSLEIPNPESYKAAVIETEEGTFWIEIMLYTESGCLPNDKDFCVNQDWRGIGVDGSSFTFRIPLVIDELDDKWKDSDLYHPRLIQHKQPPTSLAPIIWSTKRAIRWQFMDGESCDLNR